MWNVKVLLPPLIRLPLLVEIDTLWNVKEAFFPGKPDSAGRNRYIVECKVEYGIDVVIEDYSRNRYIVECKDNLCRTDHDFM